MFMIFVIITTTLAIKCTGERKQITTTKSWSVHGIFSGVLKLVYCKNTEDGE